MYSFGWYPDRTEWRHNPDAFHGLDRHHTFGRKEQLVFEVRMPYDRMAVREVPGTPGHLGDAAAIFIEKK